MTDYGWFRLIVRAIGVLLIGLALPTAINYLAYAVSAIVSRDWLALSAGEQLFAILGGLAGFLAQGAFGVYLLFGGSAIIRYCTRDISGLCGSCGYDLKNLDADRCPECGSPAPKRPRVATPPRGES